MTKEKLVEFLDALEFLKDRGKLPESKLRSFAKQASFQEEIVDAIIHLAEIEKAEILRRLLSDAAFGKKIDFSNRVWRGRSPKSISNYLDPVLGVIEEENIFEED